MASKLARRRMRRSMRSLLRSLSARAVPKAERTYDAPTEASRLFYAPDAKHPGGPPTEDELIIMLN